MAEIGDPSLNFARVNKLFNVINGCRSEHLWLTTLSGKVDGVIVITGFATSYSDITSFIKNFESSNFIHNINLNYTNESSDRGVGFQMTFELEKGYDFILKPIANDIKKTQKTDTVKKLVEKVNNKKSKAVLKPVNLRKNNNIIREQKLDINKQQENKRK